jgi:hypothetical protein
MRSDEALSPVDLGDTRDDGGHRGLPRLGPERGRGAESRELCCGDPSALELCAESQMSETVVSPRTLGPARRRHRAWSRRCGATHAMARCE